ncbi:MAG: HAD family hydrolase [Ignavibacteriales bacterium]|nr:HAD family hydrolase [Ignavibacteriales bacterium]HPO56261.1 HAD family hydrolase [Ignavibacteriaceae bacterium]
MKYRTVIFDFDSTLAKTNRLIFDSFQYITRKYLGIEYSDNDVINLFGPTEEEILRKMFPENADEVIEDYFEYYSKNHNVTEIYDGIKNLLEELKGNGTKLAIFTGKGRRATLISADYFAITVYFDLIISGDEVIKHKPSGEGITKILESLGTEPASTIMVGDSPVDLKSAREAGIDSASVLWDSYAKEELLNMNPKLCFPTVMELRNFLIN